MADEQNVQIESTALYREDHGIFTFSLTMRYGNGNTQGFGNWGLDEPDMTQEVGRRRRYGTAFGMQLVIGVIETVGVEKWEDLRGKYCRVRLDSRGMIVAIGHITRDKWLEPYALHRTHKEISAR